MIKRRIKQRSLILAVLLFFLSIPIPALVAKLPTSYNIAQGQPSNIQLVNQAKSLYQAGLFEEAAQVWQAAIEEFTASGDILNQAMAGSNLSLTYQQLGEWENAQSAIDTSLNLLNGQTTPEALIILAQTWDIQGNLQRAIGQPEASLESWQKAEQLYHGITAKNSLTQNLINQAESLQDLGLYPRACQTLLQALDIDDSPPAPLKKGGVREINVLLERTCQISQTQLGILQEKPIDNRQTASLQSRGLTALGNVFRVMGQREESQMVLEESLQLAQKLNDSQSLAIAYLALANTTRLIGDNETALNYYDQAINLAISPQQQLFAQLDKLTLLQATENWSSAQELAAIVQGNLDRLPASHATIYAQIKLSQSLIKLARNNNTLYFTNTTFSEINQILIQAAEQAKDLGDDRALAYAVGQRGRLYEITASYDSAKDLTLTALNIAANYQYPEIAYQFFWQLGRIETAQGNIENAIGAYERSINTLKSLRSDLVAINSDVQFSFRESVEPIYREFVSLLLADTQKDSQPIAQSKLLLARNTIESLQLAELDNFFQDSCVTQKPVNLDEVDPNAAILYTIILPDRLEVIAALHGQPLRHYSTAISQDELEISIQNMRDTLTNPLVRRTYQQKLWPVAQDLYNFLIKPIETDLANNDVKTLVFVLDGSLRNIPMAALYDGEQYLIEKYSVALTPGLQLLDPKPLPRKTLTTLTVGLSEGRQGFSPLPNVQLEIEQIQTEVASDVLLNESFTEANLQAKVKSQTFPLVHIATHGEFSSNEEDTFLLTWDNRINPTELEKLLRGENLQKSPIELLVLSACRTAVGDRRAALGLAGIAVRAGARSTLASLWYVSDAATTQLMSQFYREFVNQDVTKAEALRMAQQKILRDETFSHPYFWSAFVLVGNWL